MMSDLLFTGRCSGYKRVLGLFGKFVFVHRYQKRSSWLGTKNYFVEDFEEAFLCFLYQWQQTEENCREQPSWKRSSGKASVLYRRPHCVTIAG